VTVDKKAKSRAMAQIRTKDTAPELAVRKLLWHQGFRYRLHVRSLPGTPDIVLASARVAVFVNGCFWHRHPSCRRASIPKTRPQFWLKKFDANVRRDRRANSALKKFGWSVVVIWECEVRDSAVLMARLSPLIEGHRRRVNASFAAIKLGNPKAD
jgi:DNA mismatch endonuclease (patch repair protein)